VRKRGCGGLGVRDVSLPLHAPLERENSSTDIDVAACSRESQGALYRRSRTGLHARMCTGRAIRTTYVTTVTRTASLSRLHTQCDARSLVLPLLWCTGGDGVRRRVELGAGQAVAWKEWRATKMVGRYHPLYNLFTPNSPRYIDARRRQLKPSEGGCSDEALLRLEPMQPGWLALNLSYCSWKLLYLYVHECKVDVLKARCLRASSRMVAKKASSSYPPQPPSAVRGDTFHGVLPQPDWDRFRKLPSPSFSLPLSSRTTGGRW
jgi:hypothetical protein